jgi:predicted nucleic acid-binding protein
LINQRVGKADEVIAATSVLENIPLLTRDRRIGKSRIVPMALQQCLRHPPFF